MVDRFRRSDKVYSSMDSMNLIGEIGGVPFILFKSNSM